MQRSNSSKSQQGFTLMEIMIVVAILGILISVVAYRYTGRIEEARTTAAQMDIKALGSALQMFKMDNTMASTTMPMPRMIRGSIMLISVAIPVST